VPCSLSLKKLSSICMTEMLRALLCIG
jgi:hypothetical protein